MKAAILGAAGSVGAPTAFYTAQRNILEEIVLIDPKEKLLKNHTMDMAQAVQEAPSDTQVRVGAYKDLAGVDIIVVAAAEPAPITSSRDAWLQNNLKMLDEICAQIKKYANNQIIITVTNPADVCNYYIYKKLNWDRKKIVGFCLNDSMRIRWALHKATGLDFNKLDCFCMGEHGVMQVPIYSLAKYDGQPFTVSEEIKIGAKKASDDWVDEFLKIADVRTTGWLCCITISKLIAAIIKGGPEVLPVTTPLDGEYGEKNVCLGVPVLLGPEGIRRIVDLPITAEEKSQFHAAAEKVRGLIKSTGLQ